MGRPRGTRRRLLRAVGAVAATAPFVGCGGPGVDPNDEDGTDDENGNTPDQGEGAPDDGEQEDEDE